MAIQLQNTVRVWLPK